MPKKSEISGGYGGSSPLEHIFGSKTRLRILNLFFANPGKVFYLREISKRIGIQLNSIRREVENLKKQNILLSAGPSITKNDNQQITSKKFFSLNTNSLIYPELKTLLLKGLFFLENDLADAINQIGSISLIILCGAFVDEPDVPTDMLVVGKTTNEKIKRVVNNFEKRLGFEIRYTLMPKSEFQYRKLIGDKFISSILDNKHAVTLDKFKKTKNK